LMRLTQSAALVERGEFQILRLDADRRGDVVADQIQPRELFGVEESGRAVPALFFFLTQRRDAAATLFVRQPFLESGINRFSERIEHGLLFQRETDECDEVGEASGL